MSFPFAAALLAGGTSRRMGADKAFLEWEDRPLWEAQLEKLEALGPARLLLSASAEQDFANAGDRAEIVVDAEPGRGPLAALVRCLEIADLPLLVLAVDMPWAGSGFLRHHVLARSSATRGTVYATGGRAEPLAACYPPACLPHAAAELDGGKGALQPFVRTCAAAGLLDLLPTEAEEGFDAGVFRSLNHPGDLPR